MTRTLNILGLLCLLLLGAIGGAWAQTTTLTGLVVATRGHGYVALGPNGTSNTSTLENSRVQCLSPGGATGIKLCYGNWYGDTAGSNAITVTCSVEYPAGTFYQGKFGSVSGPVSSSLAAGGDGMWYISGLTLPAGATFYVRSCVQVTAGQFYPVNIQMGTGVSGDWFAENVPPSNRSAEGTTSTDYTMTAGTLPGNPGYNVNVFGPVAVTGTPTDSSHTSVAIFGDSREQGVGDNNSGSNSAGFSPGFTGVIQYAMLHSTPVLCSVDFAVNGEQLHGLAVAMSSAISLRSSEAAVICNRVIGEDLINDLKASTAPTTLTGMQTDLGTFAHYWPASTAVFYVTPWPYTSSTDGWTTVANQTPIVYPGGSGTTGIFYPGGLRDQLITWLNSGGNAGGLFVKVFDTNALITTNGAPEKWDVASGPLSYTADGLHQYQNGDAIMAPAILTTLVQSGGQIPVLPTSFAASVQALISLSWTAVSGATSYTVYRDGNVLHTGLTSASDSDIVALGISHTYAVAAANAAGTSATTASVQASSGTILTLTITRNGSSQPVLTWTADPAATLYKVYRSTDGANYTVIATPATGTLTYTDTARPAGATVYYHITSTH